MVIRLLFCAFLGMAVQAAAQLPQPPKAKKIPMVFEEWGNKRIDNYYWMNQRDSGVIQHLQEENAYAASMLQHTQRLQDKLYQEIRDRQTLAFTSLPVKSNGYWYYERNEEDKPYPLHYRRKELQQGPEELLQDVNELAQGQAYFRLQKPIISPDNRLALLSMNTKGDNRYFVKVKDLQSGLFLADSVADKAYNYPLWARDSKSFFYVALDTSSMRSYQLRQHVLGTPQSLDKTIFHEQDSNYYIYISPSNDRRYLFLTSYTPTSSEVLYLDLHKPAEGVRLMAGRRQNTIYQIINAVGEDFYLYTNHGAPNFKIVKAKAGASAPEQWQDVIAEQQQVYLEPYGSLVKHYLITKQRVNGQAKIQVHNVKTGQAYFIPMDQDIGYVDVSYSDDPLDADSIRLSFSSYAVPDIDYSFNLQSRKKTVIRQKEVKNFSSEKYVTKVLMVPVRDGTLVPVSMVYHKDKYKQDGQHPMLLETYSWYNIANDPFFRSELISLLDRGFVYVYPHARGGAEKGPSWWHEGRRMKRMNTFYDVLDCAQYLVDHHYTGSNKLVAMGRSAGGTNIGALLNLKPELFRAAIAEVPWLDVVTDMKNINVPGVAAEYEEEGNPWIEEEYHYMTKWSPYDNVKEAHYPRVLATASWYDNNVPFYHAAKWVAKLREHNKGDNPVLLITNLKAGHGGASNKFEKMKTTALTWAFVLNAVGVNE